MRQPNKSFIQYILLIGLVYAFNNAAYAQANCAVPVPLDLSTLTNGQQITDMNAGVILVDTILHSDAGHSNTVSGNASGGFSMSYSNSGTTIDDFEFQFSAPVQIILSQNQGFIGWFDKAERWIITMGGGATMTVNDPGSESAKVGGSPGNPQPEFSLVTGNGTSIISFVPIVSNHLTELESNWFATSTLLTSIRFAFDRSPFDPSTTLNHSQIKISICATDHGDALGFGDASHLVQTSLYLGTSIDAEGAAQDNVAATGDDLLGPDADEDGVSSFPTQAVGGVYTLTGISTNNTTGGPAMLCGWFDFDQDGSFDNDPNTSTTGDDPNVGSAVDSGERSCINIPDGTTSADLSWTIPIAELPNTGNFYFRFRLTTDADYLSGASLAPTGLAVNGEVEDYLVNIALPVELSYFGVAATYSGVLAKWTTESETENLGFTLDRRLEGTAAWSEIATYQTNDALLGQGSTPSATDYEYLDALVTASTTYEYRLADVDYNNTVTYHATRTVTVASTPSTREVLDEFTVKEAYPNPFNPSTTIDYYIPLNPPSIKGDDVVGGLSIQIYDITGKLINTLIDQVQPSGWHSVQWNGKDQVGANVPAGAYLVRVKAGTDVRHTKVMLLK